MKLKLADVEFDHGSVVDPAGKVFHYGGRVFRAIPEHYATIYTRLLHAPFINKVFDAGLIETWIADVKLEGFPLVLEHKKIHFLSKWTEWSSEMIKDATIRVCELNLELTKHGYYTKDAQPGNIQFVQGRAYWIDFGSIEKVSDGCTFPFDQFRYHSVFPLWLLSKNYVGLSRAIYSEVGKGYLKVFSTKNPFKELPMWYSRIISKSRNTSLTEKLEMLLPYLDSLDVKSRSTFWTSYGQGGMPSVDQPEQFKEKATAVYKLLQKLPNGTLLDTAGNKGWHAELAAHLGHEVVSFDIDDASVCHLYKRVKKSNLKILPLVMNFLYPTPPFSIGLGKGSAFERLQADTVLVLALIHHLVFKQGVYFEPIARIVSEYSNKFAILEFVPKEDKYVKEWYSPQYSWYTLDNFVESLKPYFRSIQVYDSWPPPRKLLFCVK